MDLDRIGTRYWRGHLARASLGERVLEGAKRQQDRATPAWHFDAIPDEIRYILATRRTPGLK